MYKLTFIIGVILFSGHFSFGQCTAGSFALYYNASNTCCDSCTFNNASPPCYSNQCNHYHGSWWQAGGGKCTAENYNISLDSSTSHCAAGSNGVELIILLGFEGLPTNYVGAYMRTKIYCGINPPPDTTTALVFDQIEDQFDTLSNNSNITFTYYAECASPNKLHIEQILYTTGHENRLKISENRNSTCLNCGVFNFLPISIRNEKIHHNDGQLHYTFDMEDTDLEVAAIALGRSTDGSTFHPVSFTDPHPIGSQYTRYRLVDKQPELPAYYRVELLTHDGEYKYGNVLFAESGQAPNPLIHPNPVSRGGKLVLEYAGNFSQGVLADIHGRTSHTFPLQPNENGTASVTIPSHLPVGIYLLRLNNQFQAAHYRVVVSD